MANNSLWFAVLLGISASLVASHSLSAYDEQLNSVTSRIVSEHFADQGVTHVKSFYIPTDVLLETGPAEDEESPVVEDDVDLGQRQKNIPVTEQEISFSLDFATYIYTIANKELHVNHDGIQSHVFTKGKTVFVVFRGSDEGRDWQRNIDFHTVNCPLPGCKGKFHKGFYSGCLIAKEQLVKIVNALGLSHVVITGHSLGGAIAQIMALEATVSDKLKANTYEVGLVTFGSPRVGNPEFATFAAAQLPHAVRVVNCFPTTCMGEEVDLQEKMQGIMSTITNKISTTAKSATAAVAKAKEWVQEKTRGEECDLVTNMPLESMGFKHFGQERKLTKSRGPAQCCTTATCLPEMLGAHKCVNYRLGLTNAGYPKSTINYTEAGAKTAPWVPGHTHSKEETEAEDEEDADTDYNDVLFGDEDFDLALDN
eukprot:CAMPEP_0114552686 /NCGR_PEP_ID=MMETSP0114-20121206/7254_1 /TAXON_ID=31324 /ORGANISM="Goniomonas sp, Strain m" /LENGTH=424 /DNA_ID=CAMNT_0001737573 /DNA_START=30 /DNA_END=1304 /DNA_ORIENTATION=+